MTRYIDVACVFRERFPNFGKAMLSLWAILIARRRARYVGNKNEACVCPTYFDARLHTFRCCLRVSRCHAFDDFFVDARPPLRCLRSFSRERVQPRLFPRCTFEVEVADNHELIVLQCHL